MLAFCMAVTSVINTDYISWKKPLIMEINTFLERFIVLVVI